MQNSAALQFPSLRLQRSTPEKKRRRSRQLPALCTGRSRTLLWQRRCMFVDRSAVQRAVNHLLCLHGFCKSQTVILTQILPIAADAQCRALYFPIGLNALFIVSSTPDIIGSTWPITCAWQQKHINMHTPVVQRPRTEQQGNTEHIRFRF